MTDDCTWLTKRLVDASLFGFKFLNYKFWKRVGGKMEDKRKRTVRFSVLSSDLDDKIGIIRVSIYNN